MATGIVVGFFITAQIREFFIQSRFLPPGRPMFEIVRETFLNPWTDVFYIIALGLLGYHLKHGFQSAFQTFGLRNSRYQRLIELIGMVFWLLIPLAFAAMPLYFLLGH